MPEVRTTIDIAAPPAEVWRVLADFSAYPQWNPTLVAIHGHAVPGRKLGLRIALGRGLVLPLRVTLDVADPGRHLEWSGQFPGLPALVRGAHFFLLEPGPQGTRLVHGERFEGLLIRDAVWKPLSARLYERYNALNEALKQRCEAAA